MNIFFFFSEPFRSYQKDLDMCTVAYNLHAKSFRVFGFWQITLDESWISLQWKLCFTFHVDVEKQKFVFFGYDQTLTKGKLIKYLNSIEFS